MQFEFCAVPLDCKASAFIYLCLGLFVHLTGAVCSLGVPVPRYNDDCHVGQLFHLPASASLVPGKVLAEAAAYIMCYLPTEAGYFIGTAKLQWVASMVFRFIGFLCDSSRQGILLPDDKRLKLSSLIELPVMLVSESFRDLQGRYSLSLAVPGCKLHVRETLKARFCIGVLGRVEGLFPVAVRAREVNPFLSKRFPIDE